MANMPADGPMSDRHFLSRQGHAPKARRCLESRKSVERGETALGHVKKTHIIRQMISIIALPV